MHARKYHSFLWIFGGLFLIAACNDYADVHEQMIQEELQRKIANFRYEQRTDCKEDALRVATKMVDSILIARAKSSKDSLNKPPIPDKPTKPDLLSPMDSSEVGPILKN